MSEHRWAHGLFAGSADLREQANQPLQLTLVRRGVYESSLDGNEGAENLFQSLAEVHRQHHELGDLRTFQQAVVKFVDEAIQRGSFSVSSVASTQPSALPPVDLLTRAQMQAIRAYTLQHPPYFDVLNKLLYDGQNGVFDKNLNAWQEFLLSFDTGLKRLQHHQQLQQLQKDASAAASATNDQEEEGASGIQQLQEDAPSAASATHDKEEEGTSGRKLFRMAWIPEEVCKHFYIGNDVVFKGSCSASASPRTLEEFYTLGTQKPSNGDTCCVLLEFDEALSRQAVDIGFLSMFPLEDEYLFRPYLRAKVVSDSLFKQFESGLEVKSSHPVRHFKLVALDRVEPLPAILDWNGRVGISKLLELAIILAAHDCECCGADEAAHRDAGHGLVVILRDIETRLRTEFPAVKGAELDEALMKMIFPVDNAPIGLYALNGMLVGAGVVIAGLALVALGPLYLLGAALGDQLWPADKPVLRKVTERWAEKLKALDGEVQAEVSSPEGILSRMSKNLRQHPKLLQEVAAGAKEEKAVIVSLVSMLIEGLMIEMIVTGHPKEAPTRFQPFFPLVQSEQLRSSFWRERLSPTQRTGLRPFSPSGPKSRDSKLFHPVLAEIEVGDKVIARAKLKELEASKGVLASLDLLRLSLSRKRIVITLGPPDAGKTTLLNRVFGLQLAAGLEKTGRTKTMTLIPCPDMPDILLADVPGFGDAEDVARNDAVILMLSLAEIEGLMQILVVLESGRNEQHPVDELIGAMSSLGVSVLVVFTHADSRFLAFSQQTRPASFRKNKDWYLQIAKDIREEDTSRIHTLFGAENSPTFVYTCLAGPFSAYAAEEQAADVDDKEDSYEEPLTVKIPQALVDAFNTNFGKALVGAEKLKSTVMGRLTSAPRPSPATSSSEFQPPARATAG